MPVLDTSLAERVDDEAQTESFRQIVAYLQEAVGQRVAASLAGLGDPKQIGRYLQPDGPEPRDVTQLRLRESYKIVRTLELAYDKTTARAWLFGTNSRLDDQAPIELIRAAQRAADIRPVLRAARQVAMFQP
jgi:hypothetical protein